jgi:Flp pilus assembly secretin CpaC
MVALLAVVACGAQAAEPIEVGHGRAVVVNLDRPAKTVIIGDPSVADVTVQGPRLLFVFGKGLGATSLTATDGAGNSVLDVPVVVAPGGTQDSVTVHHGSGKNVEPGGRSVVFACARGCVRVPERKEGAAPQSAAAPR